MCVCMYVNYVCTPNSRMLKSTNQYTHMVMVRMFACVHVCVHTCKEVHMSIHVNISVYDII